MKTIYPFNKGLVQSSRGYTDWQTPEGQREKWLKHCDTNNKDEDISLKVKMVLTLIII